MSSFNVIIFCFDDVQFNENFDDCISSNWLPCFINPPGIFWYKVFLIHLEFVKERSLLHIHSSHCFHCLCFKILMIDDEIQWLYNFCKLTWYHWEISTFLLWILLYSPMGSQWIQNNECLKLEKIIFLLLINFYVPKQHNFLHIHPFSLIQIMTPLRKFPFGNVFIMKIIKGFNFTVLEHSPKHK